MLAIYDALPLCHCSLKIKINRSKCESLEKAGVQLYFHGQTAIPKIEKTGKDISIE